MLLKDKTLFISGGSRGIGLAIAVRAASEGANVVIAAKTDQENPRLPGTIYSAAKEIESAGGQCMPLKVDIRDELQVIEAVAAARQRFGSIDVLINNASAISLTGTGATPMKRFDLMFGVNVRGTFLCTQACLPALKKSGKLGRNPHILTLAPPLNMEPYWFAQHTAYTMAKYGMSMCVLGHAAEFRPYGIAVNALWPATVIQTAALQMIPDVRPEHCRTPAIVADAAALILTSDTNVPGNSGNFYIDEQVLAAHGVTNLESYSVVPGSNQLHPDLFL
jgi:citronellol/citronellal dehydrogenase